MASAATTTIAPADERLHHFAAIVEAEGLHGLAFQHLALCRRRAWLHLNRIDYAHLDRRRRSGLWCTRFTGPVIAPYKA